MLEAMRPENVEEKRMMLEIIFSHLKYPVDGRKQHQIDRDKRNWETWILPLARETRHGFKHARYIAMRSDRFAPGELGDFMPTSQWPGRRTWMLAQLSGRDIVIDPLAGQYVDFMRRRGV